MTAPRSSRQTVPAVVRFVLRLLLPRDEAEFFLGDLEESGRRTWLREIGGALALRFSAATGRQRNHRHGHDAPQRGNGMLRDILFDLRHGLRMMRRSPGFTAVALATMALGIGANTAVFSIVNGVILKPLPYPDAHRIVRLWESNLPRGWSTFSLAPPNYLDWRSGNRSLDLFGAYRGATTVYTGGDRPRSLAAYRVSEDYLEIVGGRPSLGRAFTAEDMAPGAQPVVILTQGFWQSALGADPGVLGKTLTLDGVAHIVVGILPRGWRPPTGSGIDLVLPLTRTPQAWSAPQARSSHFLHALGRLKPGVTPEQAQADFSSIASALAAEYPESNTGWGAVVRPLDEVILGPVRAQLLILMASVGLVLLIASANLVNMMLARATVRGRELAIRTAVGAGRGRVIRQLLAESVLLAGVGGALGVGLAYGALAAFVNGWPNLLPRMEDITVSAPVLLFSVGISVASGILFGLVPALTVARSSLSDALRQGGRGLTGNRTRAWMRSGLVVAEVGLAVVLLVGTGLLVRSFSALSAENPGFRTDHRLVFSTPLPRTRYPGADERRAYTERALAELEAIPGVESAAATSLIPITGYDEIWGYWIDGGLTESRDDDGSALFYRVTPGYHETMGIPLLAGRGILPEDRAGAPSVAVVSASLAARAFPGENPLGRRLKFGRDADDPTVEIVGVVGDVQHYDLGSTSIPQVYIPYAQLPTGGVNVVLHTSVPPASVVPAVRRAIAAVDSDEPVEGVMTADAMVADSISRPRFRTFLMTLFGILALLLAVVGLYGVLAYSVSQRTREIGVRMALGATSGSVVGLVLREGAPLVVLGLGVGLAGALAVSRILQSMLFGVGARDLLVFSVVPVVLAVVAAVAMLVPARRAARVDPIRTLGDA